MVSLRFVSVRFVYVCARASVFARAQYAFFGSVSSVRLDLANRISQETITIRMARLECPPTVVKRTTSVLIAVTSS